MFRLDFFVAWYCWPPPNFSTGIRRGLPEWLLFSLCTLLGVTGVSAADLMGLHAAQCRIERHVSLEPLQRVGGVLLHCR